MTGRLSCGHSETGQTNRRNGNLAGRGSLRSIRKIKATGELVTLSAVDPLNLVGILTPGARIASVWKNRILLRDGVPVAGLEAGKVLNLNGAEDLNGYERSLKIGRMPTALRRYY